MQDNDPPVGTPPSLDLVHIAPNAEEPIGKLIQKLVSPNRHGRDYDHLQLANQNVRVNGGNEEK